MVTQVERSLPSTRQPLVDEDRSINRHWYKFLELVNDALGGDRVDNVTDMVADINALSQQVGNLQTDNAQLRADLTAAMAVITLNTAHRNNDAVHVPAGGIAGDRLTKQSAADGDTDWAV